MSKELDIFDFSDYRLFLKAWIAAARKNKSSNLSRLAETLRVHTTFLSHVIGGSKELSHEHSIVLCRMWKFTKHEREYFFALVSLEKASSVELKYYWNEKIQAILIEKNRLSSQVGEYHELDDHQRAIFYSSWLYLAVFAATSIGDGQNVTEVAERFQLTRERAEEVLDFLVQSGVCERKGAQFTPGQTMIYVPNNSPFVTKHHTNWRMRGMQKMETREDLELFFSFPMSIGKKDFTLIRERLAHLIKEATTICRDTTPEEVACLNIDFFVVRS